MRAADFNAANLKQKKKSNGRDKDKDRQEEKDRTVKDKMTTDELIEEYERKISITKQKLEEEQKKQSKVNALNSNFN